MNAFDFVVTSALLGAALAMDAFSVSVANGLRDAHMKRQQRLLIAGTFAFFQFLMPLLGYACVRLAAEFLAFFNRIVPWIALALLGFIGVRMIREGLSGGAGESAAEAAALSLSSLLAQGVATSIDALSSGFALKEYTAAMAFAAACIIAAVTFALCLLGVRLGRRFGMKLAGKASILGGVILLLIGVRIFLDGIL